MLFNLWMSKNALLINFLDGHYVAGQLDNTKIIKHPNNPLPNLQKVPKVIETVKQLGNCVRMELSTRLKV